MQPKTYLNSPTIKLPMLAAFIISTASPTTSYANAEHNNYMKMAENFLTWVTSHHQKSCATAGEKHEGLNNDVEHIKQWLADKSVKAKFDTLAEFKEVESAKWMKGQDFAKHKGKKFLAAIAAVTLHMTATHKGSFCENNKKCVAKKLDHKKHKESGIKKAFWDAVAKHPNAALYAANNTIFLAGACITAGILTGVTAGGFPAILAGMLATKAASDFGTKLGKGIIAGATTIYHWSDN